MPRRGPRAPAPPVRPPRSPPARCPPGSRRRPPPSPCWCSACWRTRSGAGRRSACASSMPWRWRPRGSCS
ncbi:hypothetical protein DK412_19565 [Methylobacterium sp. 17Sr1-1]|nr:hypothetical protein DK412_19565 [Methylobacterium sp. 17Sr1-1]